MGGRSEKYRDVPEQTPRRFKKTSRRLPRFRAASNKKHEYGKTA